MSASLVKTLKDEVTRLSRKEARTASDPLRKQLVAARRTVTELKARVDALERALKQLTALKAKVEVPKSAGAVTESAAAAPKAWISGKGVRSMRKAMGLTLAEFAQLADVTPKAVSVWEAKSGALSLRQNTKAALLAMRGVRAREARRLLEAKTQA